MFYAYRRVSRVPFAAQEGLSPFHCSQLGASSGSGGAPVAILVYARKGHSTPLFFSSQGASRGD